MCNNKCNSRIVDKKLGSIKKCMYVCMGYQPKGWLDHYQ